jgi:hypothetical protein
LAKVKFPKLKFSFYNETEKWAKRSKISLYLLTLNKATDDNPPLFPKAIFHLIHHPKSGWVSEHVLNICCVVHG